MWEKREGSLNCNKGHLNYTVGKKSLHDKK